MAMPAARVIRPDNYRDPASLLLTRFVLSASLPAEATAQAGIPIAFASAAATHIVQATHANAKTKAYPKSAAAPIH